MESGYYNSLYLAGLQGVFAPVHAAYHSRRPTLTLSLFAYLPRVVPTDSQTEARLPGLISKALTVLCHPRVPSCRLSFSGSEPVSDQTEELCRCHA